MPRVLKAAERALPTLGMAAAAGMFLVLLMGAAVTNTGSAEGCGRSWPLCNGQFVPKLAFTSLVEYSHRAVTGVESLLIFAVAIGASLLIRRRGVVLLSALMVVALLLQAVMGALAVMWPQTPTILALHFGISLLALASAVLTALVVRDGAELARLRAIAPPRGYSPFVWLAAVYTYVLVYSGAFVRHSGKSLSCADWPLCGGKLVPDLLGPAGPVFAHRLGAAVLTAIAVALVVWTARFRRKRPDLYAASWAVAALVGLQALAGAFVVSSRLSLLSTLAHAGGVGLLFVALSFVCMQALPGRREAQVAAEPLGAPVLAGRALT